MMRAIMTGAGADSHERGKYFWQAFLYTVLSPGSLIAIAAAIGGGFMLVRGLLPTLSGETINLEFAGVGAIIMVLGVVVLKKRNSRKKR